VEILINEKPTHISVEKRCHSLGRRVREKGKEVKNMSCKHDRECVNRDKASRVCGLDFEAKTYCGTYRNWNVKNVIWR